MTETANAAPGPSGNLQSAAMVLSILETLAQRRDAMGVTELSRALGTSKSRVFRCLRTLIQLGYVVQERDSEKYRVGGRLITLGRLVSEGFDLSAAALPVMRALRDQLGHTTVLSRLEEDGLRVIASVSGTTIYETGVKQGALLSFHHTSQGRVALALGPEGLAERVLGAPLSKETPYTIVDADALRRELAAVRSLGWATSPNQSLVGINALAAPILDASGALVGTIAIIDSVQFITNPPAADQVGAVVAAGKAISRELGLVTGPDSPPPPMPDPAG